MLRARPRTVLAGAILLLAAAGWTGIQRYTRHHYDAACRAFDEDRLEDAREEIALYLRWRPSSAPAHLLAARIERLSGNADESARHLKECQRCGGASETSQLEWVLLRAQNGELAELERGLRECLQRSHPESASILTALARAYMDNVRFRSAHNCLTELLAQNPRDLRGLHWRGLIREHTDDLPGAAGDYRELLRLAPERWQARLRLLQILLATSNAKEAAEHVAVLRARHWDEPQVRLAVARCRFLEGKTSEAAEILDALIADHPTLAAALYHRGKLEGTNVVAAERWYRQALQADPALNEARFALYFCLQAQGKTAEANAHLSAYRNLQDKAGKLTEVLTALERRPRDCDLLTRAGDLLLQSGNDHSGQQFLYKALDIDGECKKAHEILGHYFELRREAEKATYHLSMAGKRSQKTSVP